MSGAAAVSSGGTEKTRPGLVIMAAGASKRFGANKLLACCQGKPLYKHTFDAVPPDTFARIAVVSGTLEILKEAGRRGFIPIVNVRPEEGPARTIRLGLQRMLDLPACLFCVCDQPALSAATIKRVCEDPDDRIQAVSFAGVRGNPVLFPAAFYTELLHLPFGSSGSDVIRSHPGELHLIECGKETEMQDIDTMMDLEHFKMA